MRMPGIDKTPLPPHLQTIREQIAALPESERRALQQACLSDRMRSNDQRHAEAAERAEREMRRPKRDPRQMSLMGAA